MIANPMASSDLKKVDSHFAFGKNWASYASHIDAGAVEEAGKGLTKLLPRENFKGRTFLDIGCGSGLHALAAAQLGVSRILSIDIDADSVRTARAVLGGQELEIPWSVEEMSVFDIDPQAAGRFDIVYSWGVLHHSGDMRAAMGKAAACVADGGHLIVALYRRTVLDPFWRREKRWYTRASPKGRRFAEAAYDALFRLACLGTRRSYAQYVANYKSLRGMDFKHDVRDWLGGYPYESVLAPEVAEIMAALGFVQERVFARPRSLGLLGSGCDEYVYRRKPRT